MEDRKFQYAAVPGGILLIAFLDFASGVEVRVFPLYYLPISLASWYFGRVGAALAAAVSALGWLGANQAAGLQFSHPMIWVANTLMQGASFAVVGLLVAHLKLAVSRERALSRTDSLCQLLNARAFYDDSLRLLALCGRNRRPVTLAYLDLDDFKAVNDTHGHKAGDDLLRMVARTLRSSIRSADIAARLGGDEFAILLPEIGADEARRTLERVRHALGRPDAQLFRSVKVSIGAVTFPTAPETVDEMVQMADSVMYSMKQQGKNRVHVEVVDRDRGRRPLADAAVAEGE